MRVPNPSPHSNEPLDPAAITVSRPPGSVWPARDCVATRARCHRTTGERIRARRVPPPKSASPCEDGDERMATRYRGREAATRRPERHRGKKADSGGGRRAMGWRRCRRPSASAAAARQTAKAREAEAAETKPVQSTAASAKSGKARERRSRRSTRVSRNGPRRRTGPPRCGDGRGAPLAGADGRGRGSGWRARSPRALGAATGRLVAVAARQAARPRG